MPTIEEQIAGLRTEMDTFSAALESLTPKEDTNSTDKIDARDTSLAKGKAYFLTILKGALPKDKLDALTFDELVLAAELKSDLHPGFNSPPPITTEKADTDDRPEWEKATVEGTS